MQRGQHKNDVFLLSGHDGNKKVGRFWQKNGFRAEKLHFHDIAIDSNFELHKFQKSV